MYEGATHVKLISLEDYLSSLTIWLCLLFLKLFLNVWYLMKDFITWGKIHVIRLLNNWHFFSQKGFKMITAAVCEGPGGCEAMEQNPLPCLPSISVVSPAQKYGCFAVNRFRKI